MTTPHRPFRARLIRLSGLTVVLVCVVVAAPAFAFVSRSTHGIWVPKVQKGAVSTKCPGTEHVGFGGVVAQFEPFNDAWVTPTGMRRTASGQWSVYGSSLSSSRGSRLTAVAYCAYVVPPIARETTVSVLAGHVGSAVATCPTSTVVVAAGFNTRALPHFEVLKGLERIADNKLRATILNVAGGTTTITAIAYCGPGPAPTEVSNSVNAGSLIGGTARATCPVGTELLFGGEVVTVGLGDDLPHVIPFSLTAESKTRWSVAGFNLGIARGRITSLAYCR